MSPIRYRDLLYGAIELPGWMKPFLRMPELLRLKGVRLSNVDSLDYKDFGSANRYDHAIGVAYLAGIVCRRMQLQKKDAIHLQLAALLHDVGSPPFGHTVERVIGTVDHEAEAWRVLGVNYSDRDSIDGPAAGDLSSFGKLCDQLNRESQAGIQPEKVAEYIIGEGEFGYLINGTIDLDNIDNVLRGCYYLGLGTSGDLARELALWLSSLGGPPREGLLDVWPARAWTGFKNTYYRMFFDTSIDEVGRQAHLEFLFREGFRLGLSSEQVLRSTDDDSLRLLHEFGLNLESEAGDLLRRQVQRYKDHAGPELLARIEIADYSQIRLLSRPGTLMWMESSLRRAGLLPCLFFSKRRFAETDAPRGLFEAPNGVLYVFSLGKAEPDRDKSWKVWREERLQIDGNLNSTIERKVYELLESVPPVSASVYSSDLIKSKLESWGDWSFRVSRNDSLHPYPSTFVHAIPSALARSLGLADGLILDPFCGSGQTLIEAAKIGAEAVGVDVNEVALLSSKVRCSYLSREELDSVRSFRLDALDAFNGAEAPKFQGVEKWHDGLTISQLAAIRSFVFSVESEELQNFYKLAFSSILTSCTARRGKQHGWFADNTPLARGEVTPPYVDARKLFVERISRNARILENGYAWFERRGLDAKRELGKVSVAKGDSTNSSGNAWGIDDGCLDAIITSPPYLCMSDYTLGQRLSYYWLWPDKLEEDFALEVGSRRARNRAMETRAKYLEAMDRFAMLSRQLLRSRGFVAMVLGAPSASVFADDDLIGLVEKRFLDRGFEEFWSTWRSISWHRNHGYERLRKEKVIVLRRI